MPEVSEGSGEELGASSGSRLSGKPSSLGTVVAELFKLRGETGIRGDEPLELRCVPGAVWIGRSNYSLVEKPVEVPITNAPEHRPRAPMCFTDFCNRRSLHVHSDAAFSEEFGAELRVERDPLGGHQLALLRRVPKRGVPVTDASGEVHDEFRIDERANFDARVQAATDAGDHDMVDWLNARVG